MTFVLAGHIILTPTQPVGSGRPQRGSNPGPPQPESRDLAPPPPHPRDGDEDVKKPTNQPICGVCPVKAYYMNTTPPNCRTCLVGSVQSLNVNLDPGRPPLGYDLN